MYTSVFNRSTHVYGVVSDVWTYEMGKGSLLGNVGGVVSREGADYYLQLGLLDTWNGGGVVTITNEYYYFIIIILLLFFYFFIFLLAFYFIFL